MAAEDIAFEELMALREGRRNDVYLDTLNKPTVGIGHLVVAGDNLKIGDVIADASRRPANRALDRALE